MISTVSGFIELFGKEELDAFFSDVKCGMWLWRPETNELQFTQQLDLLLGYAAGELPRNYDALRELFHPDDRQSLRTGIEYTLRGLITMDCREFRLRHKDGSFVWLQVRFAASGSETNGRPSFISGTIAEITEFKQAQQYEQAVRNHIEQVMSLAGLGAWVWDLQNDYITFSESCAALVGMTSDELSGSFEKLRDIMSPEYFEQMQSVYKEYFKRNDGSELVFELCLTDRQGREVWVRNIASVIESDENGNPLALRGGVLDIDESVKALKAQDRVIEQSKQYVRQILDSLPLICSIRDDDGKIIDCGLATLRYLDLKYKSDFVDNFFDLCPELQSDGTPSVIAAEYNAKKALETGYHRFFWDYVTPKGERIPAEVTAIRIDWGDGYRLLTFSQDLREITIERERSREAAAYTQLMLDSTPLICSVWDSDGRLVDCNQETVRLFGLHDKREYIDNFYDLNPVFQPDGVPSVEKADLMVSSALKTGFARFEWEYETKNNEIIPVDVMLIRVSYENSYRVLSYSRDLREIKKADAYIQRYTNLLQAANNVANALMAAPEDAFDDAVHSQLKALGEAVGTERVGIWENFTRDGELYHRLTHVWSLGTSEDRSETFKVHQELSYDKLPDHKEKLLRFETIHKLVRDMPPAEQELLTGQGVKAVLLIPIIIKGKLWGFLNFDNCTDETLMPDIDVEILRSSGIMIAASILRNRTTAGLIAAGNVLQMNDKLLSAVNHVAVRLLASSVSDFTPVMQGCLETLGKSVGANRVSLWRNFENENGTLCSRRLPGWIDGLSYEEAAAEAVVDFASFVPEWDSGAVDRKDINQPLRYMNESIRNFAILQESRSLLLMHIEVNGAFWGFVGFAYDAEDRTLDRTEISILRSGGTMIASAIMQNEVASRLMIATDEALASVRSKNEFMARMSHEMRTPMNAVIGMTTIAKKSENIESVRDSLDVIAISAQQLLSIINDILDMNSIEMNRLEITSSPYDFRRMLENTVESFMPQLDEKHHHFNYTLENSFDRFVIGDEVRVSQVISNLLSNAIKFSPEGSDISIRVSGQSRDDGESLIIDIADTGIGIEEEMQAKVFEVFEQLDGGNTRLFGGVGLGLSITKSIVTLMNGKISVESELGKGSCFTVELPLVFGEYISTSDTFEKAESEVGDEAVSENLNCGLPDGNGKHVLLVEDIEINQIIAEELMSETGVSIDFADNGQIAVDKFSANPARYDLILMDMQMPVMDGLEAARTIRSLPLPQAKTVPIYAMTANAYKEDAEACIEAGMDGHIPKPIDIELLYNAMNTAFLIGRLQPDGGTEI